MKVREVFGNRKDLAYRLVQTALWVPFHWMYDLDVNGRENLKGLKRWKADRGYDKKGAVMVSNHTSYLDNFTIVAAALANRPVHFLARDFDLISCGSLQSKIFNKLYEHTGQIILGKNGVGKEDLREIKRLLDDDRLVVFYAEMGIPRKEDRRGDGMGEFNVGAARIAYKNKVPMIPVRLEGVDKIMPPGKFFKTYGKMKVSFGEPVDTLSGEYGNNKSDRYRNLTDCVRERVVGLGG